MDFIQFIANQDDNNRRLDKVLRKLLKNSHLSEIYKLLRKGLIKVNNTKSTPELRIKNGDIITIASFLIELEKSNIKTNNDDLDFNTLLIPNIVFENEHILIINKPYNVNVHGSNNSLDKIVKAYYNSKYENKSLSFQVGPLHRLDKKTTGLLAFSFSLEGARWFSENIQNHIITKKYYGIIQGSLNKTEKWVDFITKNDNTSGFTKVIASNSNNNYEKEAITIITPISKGYFKNSQVSLVSFEIKTGRKHQIRAQSSLHNHPLLGDFAYDGKKIFGTKQDFYLHSYELLIPKNELGVPQKIEALPSHDFIEMLKSCGIEKIGV